MEMKKGLICARDLTPDTCIFCEQEGKDYCMICADTFTEEEYNTFINRDKGQQDRGGKYYEEIFFGEEVTLPLFNH